MRRMFLAACGLVAWAQNQSKEPTIRISVDLVQIDAVVAGRDGKIVRGLGADDFEVLQNGKRQSVQAVSFIELAPPTAPRVAIIPSPSAAVLRETDVRRTITIVVDDLNLSSVSTASPTFAVQHI